MYYVGINTGVNLLLLSAVSYGEGRDSIREPAPLHRSGHVEARGGVRQHEEADRFVPLSEPFVLILLRSITLYSTPGRT